MDSHISERHGLATPPACLSGQGDRHDDACETEREAVLRQLTAMCAQALQAS